MSHINIAKARWGKAEIIKGQRIAPRPKRFSSQAVLRCNGNQQLLRAAELEPRTRSSVEFYAEIYKRLRRAVYGDKI